MGNEMHIFIKMLVVFILIMIASRSVGRLCTYVGQPRVLGEMLAGVILGPTLFGAVFPGLYANLFDADIKNILYMFSHLGLALYMFLVGIEVNFKKYDKKFYRNSAKLSLSGFLIPFVAGIALAFILKDAFFQGGNFLHFALFIAIAVSMTAFPMLARILQEKNMMKTKIGGITLLSASVIDVLGWLSLAAVIALVETNSLKGGGVTFLGTIIFVIVLFKVCKPLLERIFVSVVETGKMHQGLLALILVLVLSAAAFTDYIGVYSVFGGFMMGLIMPKNKVFEQQVRSKLEDIVVVFLVPIFFTYSGINTQFTTLNISMLIMFLIILIFSSISKYASCLITMRAAGFGWRESSGVGSLMNARGLMELIVLNVGLTYNIISQDLFSLMVWMAIITTAMALPAYHFSEKFKFKKALPSNTITIK
ncbi:cation:proton antiporter [Cytobacillus kochii]